MGGSKNASSLHSLYLYGLTRVIIIKVLRDYANGHLSYFFTNIVTRALNYYTYNNEYINVKYYVTPLSANMSQNDLVFMQC